MEYDTFTRHKLPVIGVIGNDACWTQIAREQIPMFNSNVAVDLAVGFLLFKRGVHCFFFKFREGYHTN